MAIGGIDLATAYVSIVPETSKIAPGIKKAMGDPSMGRAADEGGRSFGSRLSSGIGRTLKSGALVAGGAVAGILGTALVKGFGRLNAIEQAEAKLKGLGHSAGTVTGIMDNALASVKGTAFGLDEAATTAAGAVAAGIKPGKELERVLGLTGDTATIAGTSMGEMGSIFNKVAAGNRLSMSEVNQLSDRGVPIMQMLAEQYGVTAGEARKMVEEGEVDFADFSKAIESNIAGAALKSGDTVSGSFKNMGAALGRVGAQLLSGVFPSLKGGFSGLTDALDRLGPFAEKAGQMLGAAISWARDAVVGLWNDFRAGEGVAGRVRDALGWVRDGASAITQLFRKEGTGALAKWLDVPQSHAIIGFLQNVRDFVTVTLPAGFSRLKDVIQGAFSVLSGGTTGRLAKALEIPQSHGVIKFLQDFRLKVIAAFTWIRDVAIPTVIQFGSWLVKNKELIGSLAVGLLAAYGAFKTFMFIKNVTVAVRAFSAVLLANPLGLVVAAIGLLVGALVYLYRNNETARRIMDKAWAGIKKAISAVVSWFRGSAWPWMRDALGWIGDKMVWLWKNVAKPYFGLVLSLWKSVFGWVRNTGWPWLRDAMQSVGDKAVWLWKNVVSPYFGFMLTLWKSVFSWLRDTGVPMVRKAMQSVGDKASWLWKNAISPAFNGVKDTISGVWEKVSGYFDSFKSGVGKVASAFSGAASGISTAWNKVKEFVAKPIVAVLGFVNSGIIGGLNKVLDWAGAGQISKITIPSGLYNAAGGNSEGPTSRGNTAGAGRNRFAAVAMGGVLPGYSPGVDNMTFTGSAGRLDLSGGEAIMRPEWTRAIGAAGVNAMNALARTGGVRAVRERMGFADGGVLPGGRSSFSVGGIADFVGNVAGGAGDLASGLVAFLKKPFSFLKDLLGKTLSGIASNPLYDFAKGAVGKVASGAKDKLMSMFNLGSTDDTGGGGGSYSDRGGSWEKIRNLIQGAGFNPVIRAGGTWRPGWTTKTGFPSRHQLGKALDLLPNRGIQDFLWGIKNQFRELYLPDGRGWLMGKPRSAYPGAATTMNNHMGSNAHIHAAYAQGGLVPKVYDRGGVLPPGGLGVNMSSKPELVLTQEQLANLSRSAGPTTVYVQNPWTGEYMEGHMSNIADSRIAGVARSAVGHGARRGGY